MNPPYFRSECFECHRVRAVERKAGRLICAPCALRFYGPEVAAVPLLKCDPRAVRICFVLLYIAAAGFVALCIIKGVQQ